VGGRGDTLAYAHEKEESAMGGVLGKGKISGPYNESRWGKDLVYLSQMEKKGGGSHVYFYRMGGKKKNNPRRGEENETFPYYSSGKRCWRSEVKVTVRATGGVET